MLKRKIKAPARKVKVRKSSTVKKNPKIDLKPTLPPVHSWRVCLYGEHWVRTHPLPVPPSKTHPENSVTTRHEHCARNPSGKDQLYPEEIQEIASQNFTNLKNKPGTSKMWKIVSTIIFFSLFLSSALAFKTNNEHLAKLKSKFPNGLLSDDYGVLTLKDLALNTCRIKPPPFIPGATHVYEYWICFENKNILPTCEDAGIDETEGHVGWVNVDARNQEMSYHFFEQRPWSIRDCRSFVKDLKKIMTGTSHACISASSISKEEKNEKGQMERVGFLHRFKTRKGCEGEECELTKKFKKEYCPEFKL